MPPDKKPEPTLDLKATTVAEQTAREGFIPALEARPWRDVDGKTYRYERLPHTLFSVRPVLTGADGLPYLGKSEPVSRKWLEASTPAEPPEGLESPKRC